MITNPRNRPSITRRPGRRPTILASSIAALLALGLSPSTLHADSIVVGAGPGGEPQVSVFDAGTAATLNSFFGFTPTFSGGVTVAAGDGEIIVGSAKGGGTVNVFDTSGNLQDTFTPFGASWTGGVTVAVADGELVVGSGPGGASQVNVYDDSNLLTGATPTLRAFFNPFATTFKGGVSVGIGDGTLVVGAGVGGKSLVNVYSDSTFNSLGSFDAFSPSFTGGVNVAVGNGQVVVGAGAGTGAGSQVSVFNDSTFAPQNSFYAFASNFTGGVNVAVNDGLIVAGPASGVGQVNVYSESTLSLQNQFYPFNPTFNGGATVAILPTSLTWNGATSDWNTASNWIGNTVPNSFSANAVFTAAGVQVVTLSANTEVNSITFTSGASPEIDVGPNLVLTISGTGINNSASTTLNFFTTVDGSGHAGAIIFRNGATAGIAIQYTNEGNSTSATQQGGFLQFSDSSSAGGVKIVNNGGTAPGGSGGATYFLGTSTAANARITNQPSTDGTPGFTNFHGASTAGSATISNNGNSSNIIGGVTSFDGGSTAGGATINNGAGTASGAGAGSTQFSGSSNAGTANITNQTGAGRSGSTIFDTNSSALGATITNQAATPSSTGSGFTQFNNNSTAGGASIFNNGATMNGALGGSTTFAGNSTAGIAELINNAGSNGGQGGATSFTGSADGGTARAINNGNGFFDISGLTDGGMKIGSIEGNGTYSLGANTLTIVGNGFSTTVSGVIEGAGGSLVLSTSTSLTLLGTNAYTGMTGINNGGTLNANSALSTSTSVVMDQTGAGFSTLNLGANQTITTLTGAASSTVNLNGNTLTVNNSTAVTTFAGVIADGTGSPGSGGLAVGNGEGTLTLTGVSTYTGPTNVMTGGGLQIGNGTSGNLNPASAVTVADGALLLTNLGSGSLFASNVALNGNGALLEAIQSGTNFLSGSISGQGEFVQNATGTTILLGANTYSGETPIEGGTLQIGTPGTAASIANTSNVGIANGGVLTLANVVGGTFAAHVFDPGGNGTVNVNSANTITLSGTLVDGGVAGTIALTKNGPGTAIISGTGNTYTGATTVNGGILRVDGSLGTTTVTVNKQAALSGQGSLGGNVFIETGASIETGGAAYPTTLSIGGNLAENTGATSIFRLGGPGTSDSVAVTGNLILEGTLSLIPEQGFAPGTYTLFTYGGTLTKQSFTLSVPELPGYTASLITTPGTVQIQLTLAGGGATQSWNTAAGGTVNGGSGTWDTTSSIWSNPSNPNATTTWKNGIAQFGVTGGTVTIPAATTITARELDFTADGYSISGANATTSKLNFSTKAPTITVFNGTATINVPVSSSAGLIVNGDGSLVLANTANNIGGNVSVVFGNLQLGTGVADGSLGASTTVTLNDSGSLTVMSVLNNTLPNHITAGLGQNGTVNFASPNTVTVSGALTDNLPGQLSLNQSGAGLTVLTNSKNTNSGTTTISAGTLQIGTQTAGSLGPNSLVNFTGGGTLSLVDVSGNVFANSVTVSAPTFASVTVQSKTTLTLSGALSNGSGGLQFFQNGPGTVILSGNDSIFSTTVNSGTLQVGDGTTIWTDLETDGTAVQVNTGATLATNLAGGAILGDNVSLNTLTSSLNPMQSGTNTLTGVISGSGKVNQTGTGTTILANAETSSGTTTISAGTLQIGNGVVGSLASPGVTVSGKGTLALDLPSGSTFSQNVNLGTAATTDVQAIQPGFTTITGIISGSGGFIQNGPGATTFASATPETYKGPTNINEGTLDVETFIQSSPVNVQGGTLLSFSGGIETNVTLSKNGTISIFAPSDIAGTLTVTGTGGSWTGAGTVDSAVIVSAGNFNLGPGASLTAPKGVNVTGGTISTSDNAGTIAGSLTYTSVSSSTFGGVVADGSAKSALTMKAGSTLTLTGTNTYTGATNVAAGTLQIGNGATGSINPASIVTVASGAFLNLDLYDSADFTNTVVLNGAIKAVQAGTTELSVPIIGSGGFAQDGTGTTILSAPEQFTGTTGVFAGTLELDGSLAAGSALQVDGGTLTGFGTVNGSGSLSFGAAINFAPGGNIAGTLALTNGGGTWAGQGSVAKAVTVIAGTFTIGSGANLTAPAGLTVASGALAGPGQLTGSLTYKSASTSAFSGVIADNGATKSSVTMSATNSKLILNGTNTYTGLTTVSVGALMIMSPGSLADTPVTVSGTGILGGSGTINGVETINSGGTLAPSDGGTPTTFTVGPLVLSSGAKVNYQLGAAGATMAGVNDLTTVNGSLALGGATLNITRLFGFGTGTYELFSATSAPTGTLKIGTVPAGLMASNFSIQIVGDQVDLLVNTSVTNNAQYWNGPITSPNSAINGGSGTWDNSTTNWTNSSGTASAAWAGAAGVFSAGSGTVTVGANVTATSFGFVPGAGAYTINVNPNFTLTISGTGLTNTSGTTQNLATLADGTGKAGSISFTNSASAGNIAITNNGAGVSGGNSGNTFFNNTSTAGTATITNQGGTASNENGGFTTFTGSASAGSAQITNNVGTGGGFDGSTNFIGTPSGGTAQIINSGGGNFDMSGVTSASGLSIGSIAGGGVFQLGSKPLTVGGNGLSTTVTGVIEDGGKFGGTGGSLVKVGTGTLTLTGTNTYSGATTVNGGTLQIGDGNTGSAALASSSVVTVNGSTATLAIDLKNGHTFGNQVKLSSGGHVQALETSSFVSSTISSAISGTGDLTVNAANSTVILTGNNSYSSGTTVSAGTLVVNNTTGSGTGTNTVTVDSGATLGGSGKISGAIALEQGGVLEPAATSINVPGATGTTLTAGSLQWNPGSKLVLQLDSSGQDKLSLTGALTKETSGAGLYTLDIHDDGGIPLGDYTLATFASTTFAATDFTLDLPASYAGTLSITGGKNLVLDLTSGSGQQPAQSEETDSLASGDSTGTPAPSVGFGSDSDTASSLSVTPTPEPGSALLLTFGGAALLGWRRRRPI